MKQHYEMSEVQFEEMKNFYTKLGYTPIQVKALTDFCFGMRVKVNNNLPYNESWSFFPGFGRPPFSLPPRSVSMMGGMMSPSQMPAPPAAPAPRMSPSQMPLSQSAPAPAAPSPEKDRAFAAAMGRGIGCSAPSSVSMSQSMMPSCPAPSAEPKPVPVYESRNTAREAAVMPPILMNDQFSTAETHVNRENEVYSPLDDPQAIFSANVNTASWHYLRSKIEQKQRPDKNFVRVEEIINSYQYDLPKPENDELFSLSAEKCDCPWNKESELMFVGMKAKDVPVDVKQNLVLLVDVSGSMFSNWILVKMSLAAIISRLKKGDTLSIITYSSKTTVVAKELDGGDKTKCVEALTCIEGIGGGTYGSEGLEQAYQFLGERFDKNANNRVFIFTDGDFNFGITSEGSLREFISKKRESGIYLSIVGYGFGNFKDNKMETLAYNGNGNYTFVANPYDINDNLCDTLISNLVTVAKDVKISVELNPAYVSSYRLIGYEFRSLTQQEFNDTKKATDGIGSGHNVVALIEYTKGKAKKQYSSRYVSTKAKKYDDEFAFIEVHCKSPDDKNLEATKSITVKELEKADNENANAAKFLAAFGLCITDSKYRGTADKALLEKLLREFEQSGKYDTNKKYSHFDIIRKYIQSL